MAKSYDDTFSASEFGKCLRALVWQRMELAFAGCRRILEIGCGTGEDAVHLASCGFEVLATDASASMLKIAQEKARCAGFAGQIEFRCVAMQDLGCELTNERFDGVFSNFGAVNCAPGLDAVVKDLACLLRPSAPLLWVVMGRHVPWEWAWFIAHGKWRKAFRRLRKGGVRWRGMQIIYPTPTELSHILRPHFDLGRRRSLGLVLPPTYASGWLERSPRVLAALVNVEHAAQRWQALAALSDHYIIEAQRATVTSDA